MELELSTTRNDHGLKVMNLENRYLKVQVLPEAGARIWQITYKPSNVDLLWNNPSIPPGRHPIHAVYDDVWSGGWDELFPVDEEASIGGNQYPDHGELWTGEWSAEPFTSLDEIAVTLKFRTPISGISIEKRLSLYRGHGRLCCQHTFTNNGKTAFPFLWKLHPAFQVSEHHRIDFPRMRVVREPAFPGTLKDAPLQFAWPYAETPKGEIDLRRIPGIEQQQLYFFYGTEMADGWCAITNTDTGLACGLRFDPNVFPSCWMFATYGGWRDYNVAVLEPCTGYPLNFDSLVSAGRQKTIAPGETFSTTVFFTVAEGIYAVGSIREDGTIVEDKSGDEPKRLRAAV